MDIGMIAFGSRGDVQPLMALAKGLQRSGHSVRLVTHEDFEALARQHGLDFWPAPGQVTAAAQSETISKVLEKGNLLAIMREMGRQARQLAPIWAGAALAACQGVDLLVAGLGGWFTGLALAEKLKRPLLEAHLMPLTPTSAFASVVLPPSLPRLGGWFNYWSHSLAVQMTWQGMRAADAAARREALSLPPAPFWGPYQKHAGRPVLYGFSPAVIARPPDWGAEVHITGYWFLDADNVWSPPSELAEFLANGPAPVYIGFGSMSNRDPQATTQLVLQALAQTGQRAVLFSGWGGLGKADLPPEVCMVDSVPHDWLFQQVAGVVHHGGAGTTAAGLRAGVPSTIIPFFGDQPFWGQRLADFGVAAPPIARSRLTADSLAQALERMANDAQMRRRAAALGAQIRAEDGVGTAVRIIEQLYA